MNSKLYDKEYITFLFNKFIELAPIGNWKVELTFLNKNEMYDLVGRDDCHGVTIYKDYIELANIYLNVDAKYNDWESSEQTLFHELTHVEMRYFDEYVKSIVEVPDLYNTMRERFVNNIATAMWNMIEWSSEEG